MYTNYKYAINQSDNFTASFQSFEDVVTWFKLGKAEFATVTLTKDNGSLAHYAELTRKDGCVITWKARAYR